MTMIAEKNLTNAIFSNSSLEALYDAVKAADTFLGNKPSSPAARYKWLAGLREQINAAIAEARAEAEQLLAREREKEDA